MADVLRRFAQMRERGEFTAMEERKRLESDS